MSSKILIQERKMDRNVMIIASIIFSFIIVLSNYLVSFRVFDTHITYGAITYPVSFLVMDILSEKYNRKDVMKALRIGLILAFFPSLYFADDPRIAIASVSAFFISQFLDVVLFYKLKQKYPKLWWLRNGVNASILQMLDTFLFFHIAFLFVMPYYDVFMLFAFDYAIKVAVVLIIDVPLFYLIAVRTYKNFRFSKR